MQPSLVKIDVAAAFTGQSVSTLFDRAAGASLAEPALVWVWDLANGDLGKRRDLRFLNEELVGGFTAKLGLEQVISLVLPKTRAHFHAGEVDKLLQIRPRTRIDLLEAKGRTAGRNFYSRATLAELLRKRWLGAAAGKGAA